MQKVAAGKVSESAGQAVVKQLGKQRINNLFTHLRKIAQHPLLVRSLYSDDQLQCLAATAHKRYVSRAYKQCKLAAA